MLKSRLPIYCSGLAMALIAGAFSTMPAQAQSYDEDYAYSADADDNDFTASDVDNGAVDDDGQVDDDGPAAAEASDDDDDATVVAGGGGEQRCAAQFRSFDPSSGTYLTYEGDRVPCPYL